MKNYLRAESTTLTIIFLITFMLAFISEKWLISFSFALLIYLFWVMIRFEKLYLWFKTGHQSRFKIEDIGAFNLINYEVSAKEKKRLIAKNKADQLMIKLEQAIKNLPYANIILNQNDEIDSANQQAKKLFGIDESYDKGQKVTNLIRIPEFKKLLENPKQKEIIVPSNLMTNIKLSIQVIVIDHNLKLIIARDISELSYLKDIRQQFISNTSHELRTPLTIILGSLEMIKDDKKFSVAQKKTIKNAYDQSIYMKNVIDGLLNLSKAEDAYLNHEKEIEKVNFAQIVQNTIKNSQTLFQNHQFKTDLDKNLFLLANPIDMVSITNNLIQNALMHNPEKTIITIGWQKNKIGQAVFIIQDNGVGISALELPKIIQRFYKIDRNQTQGTGLGLAIVDQIICYYGAKLKIKSKIGLGSQFQVIFPKKMSLMI